MLNEQQLEKDHAEQEKSNEAPKVPEPIKFDNKVDFLNFALQQKQQALTMIADVDANVRKAYGVGHKRPLDALDIAIMIESRLAPAKAV